MIMLRSLVLLMTAVALAACASTTKPDASRRIWRGPDARVTSTGITVYERREIAQKVDFPTCITVGSAAYGYDGVRALSDNAPIPAGYFDSGYFLDRWRLLLTSGQLDQQQTLYVTALGSTGILGVYPRRLAGSQC